MGPQRLDQTISMNFQVIAMSLAVLPYTAACEMASLIMP